MTLIKWDPLRDLLNLQERVSRFGHLPSEDTPMKRRACWLPAVDVLETTDAYIVRVELPGVGKDNIRIELTGRKLVISGHRMERAETDYAAYLTVERVEGYFERSLNIPGSVDVDQIRAGYVDGILDLYLPKSKEEPYQCIRIECRD
ncbi:MAG: Hsp20/alpha crystallin family protein [Deltaproteobacteria bacterium]|nr:Hsp20/alpha crystallin family protein [Deltaproteobacteria bacterium]